MATLMSLCFKELAFQIWIKRRLEGLKKVSNILLSQRARKFAGPQYFLYLKWEFPIDITRWFLRCLKIWEKVNKRRCWIAFLWYWFLITLQCIAQLQFFVISLYFIWKLSAMVHYPNLVYATLPSIWYKQGVFKSVWVFCYSFWGWIWTDRLRMKQNEYFSNEYFVI